jgi:hypothetical protein
MFQRYINNYCFGYDNHISHIFKCTRYQQHNRASGARILMVLVYATHEPDVLCMISGELEIVANYNTTDCNSEKKYKSHQPEQGTIYLPAKNITLHFRRL